MGFRLACAIARVADDEDAARVIEGVRAALPHVSGRAFDAPFRGVIVGAYVDALADAYDDDPSRFPWLPGDPEEAEEVLRYGLGERLAELSRGLPDKTFAYIDVDCFGGVCYYSGEIVADGEVTWELDELAHDGHQQLLARLGVAGLTWHFPPFERGFLHAAETSGAPRRAIVGVVRGRAFELPFARLSTRLRLAAPPGWRLTPMGDHTLMLTAGAADDLWLSINAGARGLEIGGRSFVGLEETGAHLDALVEAIVDAGARYEVALSPFGPRPEGVAPYRSWSR